MPRVDRDDGHSASDRLPPGVWWLGAALCGIVAAPFRWTSDQAPPSAWLFAAAAAVAAAGLARSVLWRRADRRAAERLGDRESAGRPRASTLLAIALLAAGWATLRLHESPLDSLRWQLDGERVLLRVEGRVATTPRVGARQAGALAEAARYNPSVVRFVLDARAVFEMPPGDASDEARRVADSEAAPTRSVRGKLWVRVDDPAAAERLRLGETVRVTGWARGLTAPSNPGQPDFRGWSNERGFVGSLAVPDGALIERIARSGADGVGIGGWRDWASAVERRLDAARSAGLTAIGGSDSSAEERGAERSALLGALLLGEREGAASDELARAYARVGVGHVLAISGLHLGLLVGMVMFAVRLTGDRPRLELIVALVAVAALLLFVPARTPILRAAFLAAVLIGGALAGRRYGAVQVLSLAAIALLALRPADAFNPGFQLSVGVVAALMLLADPIATRLRPRRTFDARRRTSAARSLWRYGVDAAVASTVAWLVASPAIAWHFGYVTPLAPVVTLAIMPAVALALGLGYAGLIGAALAAGLGFGSGLADLLLTPAGWAADAMNAIVLFADGLPGATLRLGPMPAAAALAATVVLVWQCAAFARSERYFRDVRSRRAAWARHGATGAVALGCVWLALSPTLPEGVAMRVHALAMGDGDCYVLRSGEEALMIDCGSVWLGAGRETVPAAVRALGVRRVPRVIVTHTDLDHFSALADSARRLGVREVLVHESFLERIEAAPGSAEATLAESLTRRGVRFGAIAAGDVIELGEARLRVLHPAASFRSERDNEQSLVVEASVATTDGGRVAALFTGDATGEALAAARRGLDPEASVLVVTAPHHGSADPDAVALLTELRAPVVVQSTGRRRIDPPAYARLASLVEWLDTARNGAVTIEIDRDGGVTTETFAGRSDDESLERR